MAKIIQYSLPATKWRIGITSDWHEGTKGCHKEGIRKCLERFRKIAWVHLGDLMEAILPGDPRFRIEEHGIATFLQTHSEIIELLSYHKKNCLGLLEGNHEAKLSRSLGSITANIAKATGLRHLGQLAIFRSFSCSFLFAHGNKVFSNRAGETERKELTRVIQLRNYLRHFDATVKAIGHGHMCIIAPPIKRNVITAEGRRLKTKLYTEENNWTVMCPAMVKAYTDFTSYTQAMLVLPSQLGWVEIVGHNETVEAIEQYDEKGKCLRVVTPTVFL